MRQRARTSLKKSIKSGIGGGENMPNMGGMHVTASSGESIWGNLFGGGLVSIYSFINFITILHIK